MNFRFDFQEKLDLTKFKNRLIYSNIDQKECLFNIFLKTFNINIVFKIDQPYHKIEITIYRLNRNKNDTISNLDVIIPEQNVMLKDIFLFKEIWKPTEFLGQFKSLNINNTVDKVSNIIEILFKIDGLKVFS